MEGTFVDASQSSLSATDGESAGPSPRMNSSLRVCLGSGTLERVKVAKFHPAARDALRDFPEEVRRALGKAIYDLQLGHALSMPLSRPMPVLGAGAAELRIRDPAGSYRAFYLVRLADAVLIFHAFEKKTQKTPERELELGRRRLKEML